MPPNAVVENTTNDEMTAITTLLNLPIEQFISTRYRELQTQMLIAATLTEANPFNAYIFNIEENVRAKTLVVYSNLSEQDLYSPLMIILLFLICVSLVVFHFNEILKNSGIIIFGRVLDTGWDRAFSIFK